MIKLIYISVLTLLIFGTFSAFGATQEVNYFQSRYMWTYDPTICLHAEVSSNAAYEIDGLDAMLIDSLQRWMTGLNYYAGDEFFKVYYKQVAKHSSWEADLQYQHYTLFFPDCDINVFYLAAPALDTETGQYFHGWASHQTGSKHRVTVLIWTYDYDQKDFRELSNEDRSKIANATGSIDEPPDVSWFEMRPTTEHSLKATTDHEIGHAFGLGHFKYNGTLSGCDGCTYIPEIAQQSVMYYSTPKTVTEEDVKFITDFDIQAMLDKYLYDGFGGETNFFTSRYLVENVTDINIDINSVDESTGSGIGTNYHVKRTNFKTGN